MATGTSSKGTSSKSKDSKSSTSKSAGGYSAAGGADSPSERGPGPGVGLGSNKSSSPGSAGKSGAGSTGKTNRDGTSSKGVSATGTSTKGTSTAGAGRGLGAVGSVSLGSQGSMSVSAKGGVGTTKGSGATARAGLGSALGFDSGRFGGSPASASFDGGRMGNASGGLAGALGKTSRGYTAAGGLDSPSEKGQGPGLGVSFDNSRFAQNTPTAKYSAAFRGDSPSEMNGAGPGVSVASFSSDGTSALDGYNQAAKSLQTAGLSTIGGKPAPGTTAAASMSFRDAELDSLNQLHDYEKEVVGVVDTGPGYTTVQLRDGTIETRRGTFASRNNNPGNIEDGSFTASIGSVPTTSRFAVFASPDEGRAAIGKLLDSKNYHNLSVETAISRWAPSHENDTSGYVASVARDMGVPKDTKLSDLNDAQREAMVDAISKVEGNTGYTSTVTREGRSYGVPRGTPSGDTETADGNFSTTSSGIDQGITSATTRSVDRFAGKYLGRDVDQRNDAEVDSTAKRDLTAGQKFAAGAVDVGLGMVPGIGVGASLVNGALTLAGKPTLGQMAVDGFVNGTGGAARGTDPNSGGSRNERAPDGKPETDKTADKPADPVQNFVSKYISRPTPAEKWGRPSFG